MKASECQIVLVDNNGQYQNSFLQYRDQYQFDGALYIRP